MTTNESPAKLGQSNYVRLLKLPDVKARTGLSRSEVYRRVALGTFAAPVKLGEHASAWVESEVSAWIADRIAARDAHHLDLRAELSDAAKRARGREGGECDRA